MAPAPGAPPEAPGSSSPSLQDRKGADEKSVSDAAAEGDAAHPQGMNKETFSVRPRAVAPLCLLWSSGRGKCGVAWGRLQRVVSGKKKRNKSFRESVFVRFAGRKKKKIKTELDTISLTSLSQARNNAAEGPSSDSDSNQDGDGLSVRKEGNEPGDAWEAAKHAQKSGGQPAEKKVSIGKKKE